MTPPKEAVADGARQGIIHEEAFREVLAERLADGLRFFNLLLRRDPNDWLKRHFVELARVAHDLETLLDDFEARNNKTFSLLTELLASLRGFSLMGTALKHLLGRFARYNVTLEPSLANEFFAETEHTARFLTEGVLSLLRALYDELAVLGVPVPEDAVPDADVADEMRKLHLPHNIDEEDVSDEEQRIAEIATKLIVAAESLAWAKSPCGATRREQRDAILARIDEERARQYESLVHNIQSKYDTYVKATNLESQHEVLPRIRGHVSLALHLLEVGTQLVHFYERHENDIRYEAAKARISRIVEKEVVLDRLGNYAYRFAALVLDGARAHAEVALKTFVRVQRLEVDLAEDLSLHARPISLIVKIVNRYGTHVEMELDGAACNAGSIMEMIMLAGSRPQSRRLVFRGDVRPLCDVRLLFENGLGEKGLEVLPAQLEYLKH